MEVSIYSDYITGLTHIEVSEVILNFGRVTVRFSHKYGNMIKSITSMNKDTNYIH